MIARATRLLVKLTLLGLVLWIAQRAWTRWVNGPEAEPADAPWSPVSGASDAGAGPSRSTRVAEGPAPTTSPAPEPASSPPSDAEPKAAAPAKRAAKKAPAGSKTAPGKIVAAKKTPGPGKKAAQASGAAPTPARIAPGEKRASANSKWLPPDGDQCPPTHPVKAKIASMIYHLPGTASYVRTTPDRCYATAEDAEADGFARAKR